MSVSINLAEALLGFERVVLTHLDGRGLRVTAPSPGSPGHRVYGHGDEMTIKGEDFPSRRSHITGDLVVRVLVEMPTTDFMSALPADQRLVSFATFEAAIIRIADLDTTGFTERSTRKETEHRNTRSYRGRPAGAAGQSSPSSALPFELPR